MQRENGEMDINRISMQRLASLCISIGLCVVIGVAFSACGSRVSDDMTPTETVKVFLDAFKAQDEETMNRVYAGEGNDFLSAYENREAEDALTKTMQDELMAKWYDFDYKITGETIADDGQTATVDLSITTYDMQTVFNEFYSEYMGRALEEFSGNSNNVTEDDYNKLAAEILQEKIAQATEKDYTSEASLTLTKTDERWIVDQIGEDNDDFLNAITGGLMDVLTDVVNVREDGAAPEK